MNYALTAEQLRIAVAQFPDQVFILDEDGRYCEVLGGRSHALYQRGTSLVGSTVREALPRDVAEWIMSHITDGIDRAEAGDMSARRVEYQLDPVDVRGVDHRTGPSGVQHFEGRISGLPFRIGGRRAVIWLARNVTETRLLQDNLRRMADCDDLTGILNRRGFAAAMSGNGAPRHTSTLAVLDVDDFKRINDDHGHLIGDLVLQQLACLLRANLRDYDMIGRLGGDEFMVLLRDLDLDAVQPIIERLLDRLRRHPFGTVDYPILLTVSMGIARLEPGATLGSALGRADHAMYRVKQNGRDHVAAAE